MIMENHPTIAEILRLQRRAMDFPPGSEQRASWFKFIGTLKEKMTAVGTAITEKDNG